MKRRIWHVLPSAVLIALLALVARAQTGNRATLVTQVRPAGVVVSDTKTGVRFAARRGTAPKLNVVQCDNPLAVATPTSQLVVGPDGHVLQAMYALDAIGGATMFAESPIGTSGTIAIELVDPVTGEPIPFPLYKERYSTIVGEVGFAPEHNTVTRRVEGVESGGEYLPALSLALDPQPGTVLLGVDTGQTGEYGQFPVAYDLSQGSWAPITGGPHVVAGHTACTATASNDLWVGQQRLVTDQVLQASDVLQRFVCPVTVTAERIELAVPQLASGGPIVMFIVEDDGSFPPAIPPTAIPVVLDPIGSGQTEAPSFMRSYPVQGELRIRKGAPFYLHIQTNGWSLAAGAEPAATTITALYERPAPSAPFTQVTATALAFRLIGRPTSAISDPVSPTADLSISSPRASTVTATYPIRGLGRIAQPLPPDAAPIELVQLALVGMPRHASSDWGNATATAEWRLSTAGGSDPDPETYPLAFARTVSGTASSIRWTTVTAMRPVVTRRAVTWTAYDFRSGVFVIGNDAPGLNVGYHPEGAESVTQTARYSDGAGVGVTVTAVWRQLEGPMPALAMASYHSAGVATITAVYAERARVSEPVVATPTAEILQTFRVPEACQLSWVELAIPGSSSLSQPLQVMVLDPQGQPFPGTGIIQPTATAGLLLRDDTPPGKDVWMAAQFPSPPVLQPNHEYWMVVRTNGQGSSVASTVTITAALEGDRFFHRPGPSGPFLLDSGRGLSFRVIGTPYQTTAVGPVAAARLLEFSVSPNPASQSLLFRWKNGSGRMSLDIVDVSGRRVRRVADVGPGIEGSWRWNGVSDSGDKLPSGVYFARLTGPDGSVRRRIVRLD